MQRIIQHERPRDYSLGHFLGTSPPPAVWSHLSPTYNTKLPVRYGVAPPRETEGRVWGISRPCSSPGSMTEPRRRRGKPDRARRDVFDLQTKKSPTKRTEPSSAVARYCQGRLAGGAMRSGCNPGTAKNSNEEWSAAVRKWTKFWRKLKKNDKNGQ